MKRVSLGVLLITTAVLRAELPPGFELQSIYDNVGTLYTPNMNECGEVVFSFAPDIGGWGGVEVFLYDNGRLSQVTHNSISDIFPDINDTGTIAWTVGYDGFDAGEVVMGVASPVALGLGAFPSMNNLGHVGWDRHLASGCFGTDSDIYYFDGEGVARIATGLSNQDPAMNDLDTLVWTRFDFCAGFSNWTSRIMLYSNGQTQELSTTSPQVGGPTINNAGQIAWGAGHRLEFWENGLTVGLTDWGDAPALNDHGDIYFIRWHQDSRTWQSWFYSGGVFLQLTDDPFWNVDGDLNEAGEAVWGTADIDAGRRGIRLMRRIRTGDIDLDGDVDALDHAEMPDCLTGPGDFDRLCACRFLDIDHDRDVDLADFAIFQRNYGGQ